ncbi:type II toxin-antitoxin system HipA family toxin [Actinomyces trachealis]|uniref:type II toxin-antitoxin system HipA family toxin n=1 Tax=Actinomyces trachealis TaxID=2763540 RepID=UPI0018C6A21D|nr:HipA domain-containing protein [Actinomyces trachealis]
MNEAVYAVLLHGEHVGAIHSRDDFTKFIFDRDYWNRPGRMVLGRWFEDHPRKRPHAVNAVPAWFSNLLPEGRLRELIAAEVGVTVHREMDLLAQIGHDLPGAVTVRHDEGGTVDLELTDNDAASVANAAAVPGALRFSLAGMALKFSMRETGDRLAVPARDQDGDWIVKTPDLSYPGLPANELAVMELARMVGIEAPDTRLRAREELDGLGPGAWPSEERVAYCVRRFDRSADGRVHIEDFAQVLGRAGAGQNKYRSAVETVAGLAYRGGDRNSLHEMVRRTVFNLLVGNGDAHLKNWSLIYLDGRRPRLSPAYDLVCTAIYPNQAEMGLPFFGTTSAENIGREHFLRIRDILHLPGDDVVDVVDETVEIFMQVWAEGAGERMPNAVAAWIGEHREATARRLTARQGV